MLNNTYYTVILELINKYKSKGILIDSNLLLLLYIGSISPSLIKKFPRTKMYTLEDYNLIFKIIEKFKTVYTLPNILTEVNNLANKLSGEYKIQFYDKFTGHIKVLNEIYIKSKNLLVNNEIRKFGLTDTAIYYSLKHKYLLLTDDFPLAEYSRKNNFDVINFNNIRSIY